MDLGGTRMRAALVADDGTVLRREVRATPREDPRPDALVELIRSVRELGGAERAVIGVPGRVDHARGALDHAPNLPASWAPHLTAEALGEALGLPVALANDADLAAAGEAVHGAGRGFRDVLYVTLSTGVGAGVLLGRRLVAGRRSAVEAGHHVIDLSAFRRGEPATFEQLASGTAFARIAREHGLDDPMSVVELAGGGDQRARNVLEQVGLAAAVGVRNLCFLFTPEVVVIGGGLGLSGSWILEAIEVHLAAYGPPAWSAEVRPAALGDDAGLVGASAWEQVRP
ncbi:MAG: ROK family protein [Alphaproteobacteria bacterium]|nr:ROK family protein [Alphaproteobacteria bacterium]MCB9697662.1 ROK family protein [Alphaproteobacteria bacterium]